MKKRMLSILFLSFAMTSVHAKNGENTAFRCFSGKFSHPQAEDIVQVDIGLSADAHHASLIGLHNYESKFATDLHCPKMNLGRCGIHDDGGSLEILKLSGNKLTIQFNGIPQLVIRGGQIDPIVDSKIKLKTPIRVTLTERPATDCAFASYSTCSKPTYSQ